MKWILKYFVVLHVALAFALYSWLGGGTRSGWLQAWAPWVTFAMFQALMIFPQVKTTETLFQARERVWAGLFKDPLLYLTAALAAFLIIQGLNGPRTQFYSEEMKAWLYTSPPVSWLPSCVQPKEALPILWWFAPALMGCLAAKHGLLKSGKRILLQAFCWIAGSLSVAGIVQFATKKQFMFGHEIMTGDYFASFGYPNFAAAYFLFGFVVSFGIFVWFKDNEKEEKTFGGTLMVLPMIACFVGAVLSLSRAGILFAVVSMVFLGLYALLRAWGGMGAAGRAKAWIGLATAIILGVVIVFSMRDTGAIKEIRETHWDAFFNGRLTGNYQVRCATDMWKDYKVFGCGGWSYRYLVYQYLDPKEWPKLAGRGQANIHNDGVQFLCEHGLVGLGLIVSILAFCAVPVFGMWWRSSQQIDVTALRKTLRFYRFNFLMSTVLWGGAVLLFHSFFDIPFRSPAVIMFFFCTLILARGFDIKRYVNESVHSL